jgi:tripeptidyl-peptidase I
MKSALLSAAFVAFLTNCGAAPTHAIYAVHEKRSSSPRLWNRGERVDGEAILPIRIGLTQNSLEEAESHLMDV